MFPKGSVVFFWWIFRILRIFIPLRMLNKVLFAIEIHFIFIFMFRKFMAIDILGPWAFSSNQSLIVIFRLLDYFWILYVFIEFIQVSNPDNLGLSAFWWRFLFDQSNIAIYSTILVITDSMQSKLYCQMTNVWINATSQQGG